MLDLLFSSSTLFFSKRYYDHGLTGSCVMQISVAISLYLALIRDSSHFHKQKRDYKYIL